MTDKEREANQEGDAREVAAERTACIDAIVELSSDKPKGKRAQRAQRVAARVKATRLHDTVYAPRLEELRAALRVALDKRRAQEPKPDPHHVAYAKKLVESVLAGAEGGGYRDQETVGTVLKQAFEVITEHGKKKLPDWAWAPVFAGLGALATYALAFGGRLKDEGKK